MGCGCLALLIGSILGAIFVIYASTDPGPPVEEAAVLAAAASILMGYRTLGVRRHGASLRTGSE